MQYEKLLRQETERKREREEEIAKKMKKINVFLANTQTKYS